LHAAIPDGVHLAAIAQCDGHDGRALDSGDVNVEFA
jgi:hypothetical protein